MSVGCVLGAGSNPVFPPDIQNQNKPKLMSPVAGSRTPAVTNSIVLKLPDSSPPPKPPPPPPPITFGFFSKSTTAKTTTYRVFFRLIASTAATATTTANGCYRYVECTRRSTCSSLCLVCVLQLPLLAHRTWSGPMFVVGVTAVIVTMW